ncbi:MAG: PulJ/GspJ family protein [Endomicrobiales bacterium]
MKNDRGVTLTELLISIAVLGLLVSLAGTFLIGGIKFSRLSTAKGEIQRDVRSSIDIINRTLRQAQASTVTVTRFNGSQPPCSMIQFTHINGSDYRIYQLNNRFWMGVRPPAGASWNDHMTADNLRVLLFAYPRTDDDSIVSVSVCFEKATYQGASKTLQLSVEKIRIMN